MPDEPTGGERPGGTGGLDEFAKLFDPEANVPELTPEQVREELRKWSREHPCEAARDRLQRAPA